MDNAKLVDILVRDTFENAAAAFNNKPIGDNWEQLEVAMRMRQQWSNFSHEARATFAQEMVTKFTVAQWVPKLVTEWNRADKAAKS